MTAAELETVYEALATQLDEIGYGKRDLYLAKLALLLSHEMGNTSRAMDLIREAAQDLDT